MPMKQMPAGTVFALERLEFQGTECFPQYRWKQYALSRNRSLLERVRQGQTNPENWRIMPLAAPFVCERSVA